MKSFNQLSGLLSSTEKLSDKKFWAIKGGDDKRPPRPVDPKNPPPNVGTAEL